MLHIYFPPQQTFVAGTTLLNTDPVVDRVKIRRIRWPQRWRNGAWHLSLQENNGVACSITTPLHTISRSKLSKPRLVQFVNENSLMNRVEP